MLIALALVAFILYWHLGASKKLQHYWTLQREANQVKLELSKVKNPKQVVDKLKSYLRSHPNSPKGWYLLGRIHLTQRQYPEALLAFQKAHRQKPANTDYTVAFVQASFFENRRQLRPNVQMMLKRIIAQHPANIGATNLLAIDAYLKGDYRLALKYWEKILPLFQVGSRDQKVLLSMIAEAQKKLKRRE